MKNNSLTIQIFLGMLLGLGAGLLMMWLTPVGIQPGDSILALTADGEERRLAVGSGGEVLAPDGTRVDLGGRSWSAAAELLSRALETTVVSVSLHERKEVRRLPGVMQPFYLVGQLFIRLLKMLILPLIVATVLVGIASLGDVGKMGRLGRQTLIFYAATMLSAAAVGLLLVNLVRPGAALAWAVPERAAGGLVDEAPTVSDLLLRLVPTNPFQAAAELDILGVLVFTIFLALAILAVGKAKAAPVFNFFEGLNDLVYVLIGWVMKVAPVGVGCLIAYFVGIQDPASLRAMFESFGLFAACVVGGLLVHFLVLTGCVAFIARYSPREFLRHISPALMTAFGTDSSSATMPVTLQSVRKMGVSKRIAGFVIPVGATANMDGTALYEATAALFFAQAYGIDLSLGQQVIVAFTAMLAAVGAAGIPSAGLVTMALVLSAVGLPLEGIALLWAIDRPLDMCRTTINVYGDATTSRVVQTWNPDIRPEDDDLATEYEEVQPAAAHGN